ncbi:hypothetical protein DHEL01_v205235 [Diaporthe helianthi]|uniref:Telomere-associated protein Rif1 N-terminal domain-containing protein n=1 Tax=Diaporthe helianthi TaxID=158607 RepID=A0A2P5I1I9_DIAHE|nr:hypothetical protein DHEL01_v205235 [Diaporthe helianthi]
MGSVDDDQLPSSLFGSLPARPPTPPRETHGHELDSLPKLLIVPQQLAVPLRSLQTPPGISSPTSSSSRSTTRRKRVGFSSQAQYQEPPNYKTRSSTTRSNSSPVSLPSSTSRPVKGILKPCPTPNKLGPANGVYLGEDKSSQANIADMLESTLQQLAGADRESKVDAYTMLFRALKTSSNLPDRVALQNKMTVFLQFIERDLTARTFGFIDNQLVTSALKLLHTFLHFHGIASSIPFEFGVFMVDHCIRTFEDEQPAKEVVRHLMQALFLQNFPAEVMTSDRVGRLVSALHNLENHLSGKSILQSRIVVNEKLVKQCPQQMAVHSDWLQELFTDMLSSVSEIRLAAIKLGFSAAFTLNKDRRFVSRVLELLKLPLEDKKFVEEFDERLRAMLQNQQQSTSVPRIWSVVTLFIPKPNQWDYFASWSKTIQLCFNNSNPQVKREAILAWNRLTYRFHLDGRLAYNLIKDPLLSLLKRKGLRDSVLSSICNLFYYAFKPDMNLRILDDTWDAAVAPLMLGLIGKSQEDTPAMNQAAAILTGLIDCQTRRVWREDRITAQNPIKAEELPAIEAKWIRANSERVFALVNPILEMAFGELSQPDSQGRKLWKALVHSVASASTKDVKLHDDTAKFVASAFTFLHNMWTKGPVSRADGTSCTASQFLDSTQELLLTLIQGLGLLPNPFTEKQFQQTRHGHFVVSGGQTSRSGKKHGSKRIPLHHLFCLLSKLPPGIPDDEAFIAFFPSVFAPFFDGKSPKTQADLTQELLRLLPADAPCPSGPWVMAAGKISTSLESSQYSHQSATSGSGNNLGSEFRDLVKVLERGLRTVPCLPWQHWLHLFQAILRRIRQETGDAGVAIALIEPLAATTRSRLSDENGAIALTNCIGATNELIAASTQPRDKQAADAARRRLWGTSIAGNRPSFDPLDNIYKLFVDLSKKLYTDVESHASAPIEQLLDETKAFFERGNPQLLIRTLVAVQGGLACWLEDKDRRITRADFPSLVEATQSLWKQICSALKNIPTDKIGLESIEPLLCSAFKSTHLSVVKITAEMWNHVYGHAEAEPYPEALKQALIALGSSVDVARPGLELLDELSDAQLNFVESQAGVAIDIATPARTKPVSRSRPSTSRKPAPSNLPNVLQVTQSSPLIKFKSKGRTPKPKFRHEDSQMQFAAIDSSPAPVEYESQLLTERQKETRERQRDTAALFPEMRSSPSTATRKARAGSSHHELPTESARLVPGRASTPEHDGAFEDYLTSTPTPRRGQPLMMPVQDQELSTDPPSSPPEPRGYRLMAELKTQANNTNSLDEWRFSSSPLTGSPSMAPVSNSTSQPMELDDVNEDLRLGVERNVVERTVEQNDVTSSQLPVNPEVIEETAYFDQGAEAELLVEAPAELPMIKPPTTPSGRVLRSKPLQATPKSDNDEFVDAPSSPLPPTPSQRIRPDSSRAIPRRSPRVKGNSQSFSVSDSFENGMRNIGTGRFEIDIRSSPKKKDVPSYDDILPESPGDSEDVEKVGEAAKTAEEPTEEAAEDPSCITVEGVAARELRRGRTKRARRDLAPRQSQMSMNGQESFSSQGSVGRPRTPITQLATASIQEGFENVSPGSGTWIRKRKRSVSMHSSGHKKRGRQDSVLKENEAEVHGGQPAVVVEQGCEIEMPTSELYEHDVSPTSGLSRRRSPGDPSASQELSTALFTPVDLPRKESDKQTSEIPEHADDEDLVQSQLAREGDEASADTEAITLLDKVTSAQLEAELVAQFEEPAEHSQQASHGEEASQQQLAEAVQGGASKFDRLRLLLQDGLGLLRSADLTRDETNQLEDMFMDMKQELYQAERRGRK